MVYQSLIYFPFYTNLYEQRFDTTGNAVWSAPSKISTLTTASYRYFDVHIDNDSTYVGYYGNPSGSNRFDAYVQKINPNGVVRWGTNGSAFANFSSQNDPYEQTIYIAKDKSTNAVWAVCTFTNSLQTSSGVYAQKFDNHSGEKFLGNNGKVVLPISSRLISLAFCQLSLCNSNPLFLVTDNSNRLAAVKLNSDGDKAWKYFLRPVGASGNTKFRYGFTGVYKGQAVAVWQENKGGGDMPYAQNINCNGSTGPATNAIAEENPALINSLTIKNIYPNPVQNVLSATINSLMQTNIHIYITDVSGNVTKQFLQSIQKGNNLIQLNVSSLHAGNYFIKVMNEKSSAATIFNKQ
jgi:hypothetical protein